MPPYCHRPCYEAAVGGQLVEQGLRLREKTGKPQIGSLVSASLPLEGPETHS